ncbi:TPA: Flp pilus assembly complex ATPase component TadA [Candidatus Avigastranaerophilus faecigallinarum]|nr:Flp pilus assembly complex ATPase component TadA [Candidatus Avigastranaerophilus faecigallinarum]
MTSSILEKIKPVIDFSLVSKFDTKDMQTNSYIPICIAKGSVYVLVKPTTRQNDVVSVIYKVLGTDKVNFKNVSDSDFSLILSFVIGSIHLEPAENVDVSEQGTSSEIQLHYDNDENIEDDAVEDGDEHHSDEKYFSKKIGEVLVQMGLVTNEQIFNALVEAKRTHIPLGTILVQQGVITLDELKKALTAQQGYEAVTTEQLKIPDSVLSMLPEDFIKMNKVLPISYDDKVLVVGMVNPNDKKVINDIIFLTGLKPSILIITHYEFSMCTQNLFNENKKATSKIIKKIEKQALAFDREETLFEQAQKELKDDSNIVVKFVNKIISDGIDMKASDIHIEPRLEGYVVRYRKDGILREVLRLPPKTESAILTRLKVISKMNIAEHRRPQDGSFSITYKDRDYDFRINTLPVADQEKMVIRILAPAVSMASSKDEMVIVGASKEDTELIKKMESVPNGIILTTGPTGSGKTTTLYTLLKAINDEKINITTIEDPIEIRIDGINQSQINTKAGITFASCMRAILRQDPDVILVGEIRDIETLETAISAALTGHLVLSTLHTNSAASTITRLIDMGAKDYLVSSTLVGIIAQRLVRNLCPHCRTQCYPSREEAELVIAGGEKEIQEFMKTPIYKPCGCDKCNFEGYSGRIGVYEIMPITKEIKRLIAQGAHDVQIEEAAVGAGMHTLHQACLKHIIEGRTTISEFVRVLGPVKD